MTILINMDLCPTREIENSTIIHECCHVYLDLPFFKLQMPDTFKDAIQMIIDLKGITQNELAMRMGVSRAAPRKWCAVRPSLRHVAALCIAMDVRADVGEELVRLAGLSFQNNLEHNILRGMLYETRDLTVARANEIMRQNKLPPITDGRDEEIAC